LVKSELIKQLHQKHPELNRSHIESVVNIFFDTITASLAKYKPVELRSWGRFSVKTIKAKYNARSPASGEIIYVPEKKKVSFKMSKHLKQEINKKIEQ
jgi:nucleoid DNA-binding protein